MYEFRFVHQHGYISGEYGKVVTKQNRYGRYFVFRTLNNEEIPLKKAKSELSDEAVSFYAKQIRDQRSKAIRFEIAKDSTLAECEERWGSHVEKMTDEELVIDEICDIIESFRGKVGILTDSASWRYRKALAMSCKGIKTLQALADDENEDVAFTAKKALEEKTGGSKNV